MHNLLLYALGLARPAKRDELASQTHVDLYDYGLSGSQGADTVMQQIRRTPFVTHINLGHNPLGDFGLSIIVDYLHREGRDLPIEELSLNNCDISDSGLGIISRYIWGNRTLRRLYLMGNNISGSKSPIEAFADSLNHSRIQTLVLTNNERLSDRFLVRFLGNLDAPYLRELQLSRIGLTQPSLPVLKKFLTSPSCYGLRSLHLNANSLSNKGVHDLVDDLLTGNTTLCGMEAFANSSPGSTVVGSNDSISDEAFLEETLGALKSVLARNSDHLRKAECEAKALLVVARTLLLTQSHPKAPSGGSVFPWRKLMPELQHYILRHLHTTLSDAQHTRVCIYASSKATLPSLRPIPRYAKEYIEDYLIAVGCNRFEGF